MGKRDIGSVAEKNRKTNAIFHKIRDQDNFLILGHQNPDIDCLASMVACALLLSKFRKTSTIFLPVVVVEQFDYLWAICHYNGITLIRDQEAPLLQKFSALIVLDTPKPSMIMKNAAIDELFADPQVVKIELDHHLESDSEYCGDEGYSMVYQASSTCEIIGFLCLKLARHLQDTGQYDETRFFTRNIVLSILTGIAGDSQMGRYLRTSRERWIYWKFNTLFRQFLEQQAAKSGHLSSIEDIYDVISSLSTRENDCYDEMQQYISRSASIHAISLDRESSERLLRRYGSDILVNVSRSAADRLAEDCGKLGMVGYYDDLSDLVQFRLRRSSCFTDLDLRTVLQEFGITNGGGHPGAVGFRLKKDEINDIRSFMEDFLRRIESLSASVSAAAS